MEIMKQYRGIIHNHSVYSKEGCYPLNILRQRWASEFDFAAMTEHAEKTTAEVYASYIQECETLSDEHFRFIPGLEVATESGDMLLLGCRKYICTTDPFQVLKEASGCLILLAHPEAKQIIPAVLEQVDGFEGWNSRRMGSYMPPLDWFVNWKRQLLPGKIMTGGNDIHKIDPKRKIATVVQAQSNNQDDILEAIKHGQFTTSNGIFSFTSNGRVLYRDRKIIVQQLSLLHARCYRLLWRSVNASLHFGGGMLMMVGIDKQGRNRISRMFREHF